MIKRNSLKNNTKRRLRIMAGFTLVETLVAISILSLSVLGTFTAVQSGLSKSSMAKDQVTAYYLIQEAVEFLRNKRDQNQLQTIAGTPTDWLAGIADNPDPCYGGNYCYIDSYMNSINTCNGGTGDPTDFNSCPYIKYDSSTGLYGYINGSGTQFKRGIQIENTSSPDEAVVTIRVDWRSGAFNKSIKVKEWLYNSR